MPSSRHRVDRLDGLVHVHRHDPLVQVPQDGVQALAARFLDVRDARAFDRFLERVVHRALRVEEHARQPRGLRQLAHQPRAHHHLHAGRGELAHALRRILAGGVRALLDGEIEQALELVELRRDLRVGDDGDALGDAACLGERLQHVEAGDLEQHDGQAQMAPQVRAVRAGGEHDIGLLALQPLADRRDGLLEAFLDDVDVGARRIGRRDVLEQRLEFADADCPDDRLAVAFHG
jgi:hypothetical protein